MLRPTESSWIVDRSGSPRIGGAGLALLVIALGLAPASASASSSAFATGGSPRTGVASMLPPQAGSLLVEYYEAFRRDRDVESFRRDVGSRYSEGTLARVLQAGEPRARRASVLALGMYGSYASNAAVARGLRDPDPAVRILANDALWSIWFRADTPENNEALERVRTLVDRGQLDEAIEQSNRLIASAPGFAEAYNQRAIAHFFQQRFAESVEDCKLVLERNPYHIGALGGMGQGQLRLGLRDEAIKTFRRSLKLQPYNDGLREAIADLEGENR